MWVSGHKVLKVMIQLLIDNPLLLLFVVAAVGYLLGKISIRGSSLGVAAVLFVGLAVGSLHPELRLPELVYQLGLVIFVYTIGISSGRQFFASFRQKGLRDNLFVILMLLLAALVTVVAASVLAIPATLTAGLFAGSLTNTAALAGVLDSIERLAPAGMVDQMLAEPVVAFSITYPMGVIGMILAIVLMQRLWRTDYQREAETVSAIGATSQRLQNQTILVTREEATLAPLGELVKRQGWDVTFGRWKHNDEVSLSGEATRLAPGDLVSVIGPTDDVERVTAYLGQQSNEHLELDRSKFDFRRVFVSNPDIAGHRLRDLNLPQQFGAIVTRVRRGDVEMLAHDDTMLELGDRVRVVARPDAMKTVSGFFGDSYRAVSEIDILTLMLGMAAGLLLGMVPIPLPGGLVVRLGLAGGPLIVALTLGALERTGPLVWNIPFSANLTLRQLGLILFLAGIGTRSGWVFVSTLAAGGGGGIFVAGALVTCSTALITLWTGHRVFGIPMSVLIGMLAGLQTQPAVLGFALAQARNELPNVGYAAVFPVAIVGKILLAQVLLLVLQ
jgi:putative transport protein